VKLIYVCRKCNLLGGQSRIAWELAKEAVREGHDVHLVARRFPALSEETPTDLGVHCHSVFQLPKMFGSWRFRSFAHLSSSSAFRLAGDTGVVHGFGDSYRQDIITLGNVDWKHSVYIPGRVPDATAVQVKTQSFLDPRLRFLVAVSQQMRRDILEYVPTLNPDKVKVIYPGIDPSRFSPGSREKVREALSKSYGIDRSLSWIVFGAGGDFEKRNIETIQRALLRLKNRKDWAFLFVGAKENQVSWSKDLRDRTWFLGHLDDVGQVFPGCDLMVYPAWFDEYSLVCLEAMAAGLPLVLSKTVGVSEIVSSSNQQMGFIQNPADFSEIVSRISELLDNPDLRRKIGADNARVADRFVWKNVYQQYAQLYQDVERMKRNS